MNNKLVSHVKTWKTWKNKTLDFGSKVRKRNKSSLIPLWFYIIGDCYWALKGSHIQDQWLYSHKSKRSWIAGLFWYFCPWHSSEPYWNSTRSKFKKVRSWRENSTHHDFTHRLKQTVKIQLALLGGSPRSLAPIPRISRHTHTCISLKKHSV